MSEYAGRVPVASLRKRHVYKTEFDIFKQNSDIDLISLISYEEYTVESDTKVSYQDYKTGNNKPRSVSENSTPDSVTDGHYQGEHHRSIKSLVRSSLISKDKKDNSQIKGFRQSERACRSAVNYKGINSHTSDVTQRSKTARGAREVERNKDYINSGNVTGRNYSNVCSRYKSGYSAYRNRPFREGKAVRSASAHGYSSTNSVTKRNTGNRAPESNSKRDNRPKTVAGVRSDTKLTGNKTVINKEICDKKSYSSNCFKVETNNGGHENGLKGVLHRPYNRNKSHKPKFQTTEFCQGSDSSESAKIDDGLDSKDSGYQSSVNSPDSVKIKTNQEEGNGEENCTVTVEEEFEPASNKKHVTFEDVPEITVEFVEADDPIDSVSLDGVEVSDCGGESDKSSIRSIKETYDFNCLLIDLEENTVNDETVETKLDTVSIGASECNSIFDETPRAEKEKEENLEHTKEEEQEACDFSEHKITDKEDILKESAMSREAKFAIIETLQDMKVTRSTSNLYRLNNKENSSASTLHRSVGLQRRLRDNRSKYDQYMRERTNTLTGINLHGHSHNRNKKSSSVYSSDDNSDECDEASSSEKGYARTNLLPSIGNGVSQNNKTSNKTKIYSLEQAKRKKYKIPGIGNFDLVMSPDPEFEITPPGFDSRYNPRPVISKAEMEPPPKVIQERSIQKCKKWLKNVNLSPLSLNPANKQ